MHLLMLDTCVWLDISSKKAELPLLTALELLTRDGVVKILLPDLVRTEYERNKDKVAEASRKRLTSECKLVRGVIEAFGGDGKQAALDAIDDVNHKLPILSEANLTTANRVIELFKTASETSISDAVKIKAAERAIAKLAPFHKNKNSLADAILVETFQEFRTKHLEDYESFRFVTHNVNDFSATDHRKPHPDFANIFDGKHSIFFNSTTSAIADLLDVADFQDEHGFAWEDQTRGLQEILSEMDELVDKVWYNRHMNMMCRLEKGDVEIVPTGTQNYANNVIHQDVLERALASAQQVRNKYDDTGPWSDFEWGMINGKLSALRWILGDEWDMLDT